MAFLLRVIQGGQAFPIHQISIGSQREQPPNQTLIAKLCRPDQGSFASGITDIDRCSMGQQGLDIGYFSGANKLKK